MLTFEHRRIIHFIHAFRESRGKTPTYEEIRDALGFRTTGPVQNRLRDLRRWGYLARKPGEARGLVLLRRPGARDVADSGPSVAETAGYRPFSHATRGLIRSVKRRLAAALESVHARADGLWDRFTFALRSGRI